MNTDFFERPEFIGQLIGRCGFTASGDTYPSVSIRGYPCPSVFNTAHPIRTAAATGSDPSAPIRV